MRAFDLSPPHLRRLLVGLSAYGGAEAGNRVVRLFAVVVIARRIDAAQLGQAALALATFELVRTLANAGIGQRIIAAPDAELAATCNRALGLFWRWCGAVAAAQLLVAVLLWQVAGAAQPAAMLAVLAGVYLTMPPGLVQVFLLMRAHRMAATARIGAVQTIADHLLTMLLALLWPSAWAIVLPKLLTAPLWTWAARRALPWRPDPAAGLAPVAPFVRFGGGVILAEFAGAARGQLPTLVIAALLGVEAVGRWYFAFNAGLGITASVAAAFGTVLFPELCRASDAEDRRRRLLRALALAAVLFGPACLLQSALAPWYVPLVFGARWATAAPLVATLALGMVPLVAAAALGAYWRAAGRSGSDALLNWTACGAALGGLWLGAGAGLGGAAAGYGAGLAIVLLPALALALRRPMVRLREQPA